MHSYFRFSCIKALLVFAISFLISSSVLADYIPASVFPNERRANLTYLGGNSWANDCSDSEKFVLDNSSSPQGKCNSCPSDFPMWDNVIVNTTPDPDRWVCQRNCGSKERRVARYGGSGYVCATCTEIWKEWRDDDGLGEKCVAKKCPADLVLDTKTGTCKEYDVTCPEWQEKVYSYSNSKPYCTSFCGVGEYRTTSGSCEPIPSCSNNEARHVNEIAIKTTIYKQYTCEPIICEQDEELVDGQCIKKQDDVCDPDSKFYFLCQWYESFKLYLQAYSIIEQFKHDDNDAIKYSLDEIKKQDIQFYNEIRDFLENNQGGFPSGQFPVVQFPPFCEWSTVVCDWYLDYKDFTDDVREWMDEYGDQIDNNTDPLENNDEPYQINENDNVDLTTTRYIQGSSTCPINRDIPVSMGGHTINIVISYRSLCDAAVMFKPFVILMSFIAGMMIITNTGRRAEVGD